MRKGTTRFKDETRQTSEGSFVISHKPSKKLKRLSAVAGLDNKPTCSKRLKLPKKLLDNGHMVNLVSVPRKSRSVPSAVVNKRYADLSSPNQTSAINRCEMPFTDDNKKVKLDPEEQHSIMENEEAAIAGLLALAGNDSTDEIKLNNEISEATALQAEDLVQECVQIHVTNESRNVLDVKKDCKDLTVENKSRKRCASHVYIKRCASHVYICQIIKNLKMTKGKKVISCGEAKTVTAPVTDMNVNSGINLNEAIPFSKNTFEGQSSGCGVQSCFGNPYCDPSQWSRPVFPNQQMWMNPFMYKPVQSDSFVQASLHNVLGSKHHSSSGYDERAMFRVDSPLTLKLALQ